MKTPYLETVLGSRHQSAEGVQNSYENIPVIGIFVKSPEIEFWIGIRAEYKTLEYKFFDKNDSSGIANFLKMVSDKYEFLRKYPSGDCERIRYSGIVDNWGNAKTI